MKGQKVKINQEKIDRAIKAIKRLKENTAGGVLTNLRWIDEDLSFLSLFINDVQLESNDMHIKLTPTQNGKKLLEILGRKQ